MGVELVCSTELCCDTFASAFTHEGAFTISDLVAVPFDRLTAGVVSADGESPWGDVNLMRLLQLLDSFSALHPAAIPRSAMFVRCWVMSSLDVTVSCSVVDALMCAVHSARLSPQLCIFIASIAVQR